MMLEAPFLQSTLIQLALAELRFLSSATCR